MFRYDRRDFGFGVPVPERAFVIHKGNAFVMSDEFLAWCRTNMKGEMTFQGQEVSRSERKAEGFKAEIIALFQLEKDALFFKLYWS